MKWRTVIAAAGVAALLLAAGREAAAQVARKLVIFDFDGKGSALVRDKIVKKLSLENVDITPRKSAKEAAANLGFTDIPEDIGDKLRIAEYLSVDAFVSGSTMSAGKTKTLVIQVVAVCEKGKVRELNYEWTGKTPPGDTLSMAAVQVLDEVNGAIQECEAAKLAPPPVTEEELEEKKKVEEDEGPPLKYCLKMADFRCGKPPVILFTLGVYLSSRSLEVPADTISYKYDGSVYPLIGFELAFHPLRIVKKNTVASPGLRSDFGYSVGIVSHPMGQSQTNIPTRDMRFSIGAVVDIRPKPESLPLGIQVGLDWGMHNFTVGQNDYISSYQYQYIGIGVGLGADIVRRFLDVRIGVDFRIPYTMGDASKFYGAKASGMFGYRVGMRLGGVIVYGLYWSLGFDWIGYIASFSGTGKISVPKTDGTVYPSGKKSKDNYPTGVIMLGYKY